MIFRGVLLVASAVLTLLLFSEGKDLCIASNGKKQPLFFDFKGDLVYPEGACAFYYREGEFFRGVERMGCSGSRNELLFSPNDKDSLPKSIAEGGELVSIFSNGTFLKYSCSEVNTAEMKLISKNEYEVVFMFYSQGVEVKRHVVYTIKLDEGNTHPEWVRHVPSILGLSSTDMAMSDTGIRTRWRSSLLSRKHKGIKAAYKEAHKHGLVRGHLAPAADFVLAAERWATFQLANVVPQPLEHNNGEWKKIENHVRGSFKPDDVKYVETGPIFGKDNSKLQDLVPIPIGLYKKVIGFNKTLFCVESYFK